ncbi:adenine phosphoribosyltransferase [Dokdonia sp. Hel_I_53]|uniref:adenine phosphoribosyltransferase n=1 Tax=Dokdonia sp. Hel_I_53 TaxID=1566287 RepID=UPI00119923F7|nr:adenine phosphoribosyltransferase [Dokdonia sp. Hel_I_53]TVZ51266.1 adenine phosphoribosyltransferase [Dokdonia sp. Hel_I_53]
MQLTDFVRDIKDFPRKGIIFKDITPLLKDFHAFAKAEETLYNLIPHINIDVVVGMESRGFFFGPLLAKKLEAGFVPVRKPNKLPSEKLSQEYALEYGTDVLEIHKDAIATGDSVLIHDDILATGGTAEAVVKLVNSLGGNVIQCNFLIELEFLKGRYLLEGIPVAAAIKY